LDELEASICKAFQGEAIVKLLLDLNNVADGGFRRALWVKIDEINRLSSDLAFRTSFSSIFIQDLGNNWVEAIGQSAYYSLQTDKKAGIVLILESMKDRKYWIRLNSTIEHFNLPIDTWNIGNTVY
jgi:hypothetical protein